MNTENTESAFYKGDGLHLQPEISISHFPQLQDVQDEGHLASEISACDIYP